MFDTTQDYVVLVDESNIAIGTMPKSEAHNSATPLHRGFSVFLFKDGLLLLQQRSKKKKTWPLVWSNSCCGHPMLEESTVDAAKRRLLFELGISKGDVYEILPNYRYKAEKDGIVENEFCPVLVAFSRQVPKIHNDEVEAIQWIAWEEFVKKVKNNPDDYSAWCIEETLLLDSNERFHQLLQANSSKSA